MPIRLLARSLLALALLVLAPLSAEAREPWQIGHGPYLTASDVTAHNKFPQDIADIRAALSGEKPDWSAALVLFTYGKHFKAHSVARFADNYNGRLEQYLKAATAHYFSPSFQNAFLFAAIGNTGRFARATEAERIAALDTGMTALLLNYMRYELGEAERKARMDTPNWSLGNGAPKNWNEVFAFYYGPDGKHGAFEAIAKLPNGEKLNTRILNALAKGQPDLVERKWAPQAAAELRAAIDAASLALFREALKHAAAAPEAELPVARARAAGFWLAAVDAVMRADPHRVTAIEKALSGTTEPGALRAAVSGLGTFPGE
ncbi:MAG TPA: hypothetical protein PL193_05100 [Xanthobacteraceae bacterium]|nr:hypothetical protein [Xanthobacteraceae bacterium]